MFLKRVTLYSVIYLFLCIRSNNFSHSTESHNLSKLLEDDKLDTGGWGKSSPNRDETLVESHGSLVGEDLGEAVDETVVDLGIGWLVHKSSSNEIEWRDSASHEESSGEGGHELEWNSIWDS